MSLSNRNIILGISGGIAAYKSAYLARLFIKAGANVQVIMTEAGTKFVTPLTFESLTNRPVAVEMFPEKAFVGTRHIAYAEWADAIVIAPATADIIGHIAYGLCPNLLTTVVCATKKPVMLAPAMNDGMFENPAIQENLKLLSARGFHLVDVGVGEMACQSFGAGRMAEPEEIFERTVSLLGNNGLLSGRRVVVTAGPCREAIDPVRFISNRSSGKMGFAIAIEAEKQGADVILITGPVAFDDPKGMKTIRVQTTEEMAHAVNEHFSKTDFIVMAAAPADFRPVSSSPQKIKKSDKEITIELTPTIDILKSIASKKKDSQTIIGFALETENVIENAKKKLIDKNLDYIVANDATETGAGFDTDTNHVIILGKNGQVNEIQLTDKELVARRLWEYIITDE